MRGLLGQSSRTGNVTIAGFPCGLGICSPRSRGVVFRDRFGGDWNAQPNIWCPARKAATTAWLIWPPPAAFAMRRGTARSRFVRLASIEIMSGAGSPGKNGTLELGACNCCANPARIHDCLQYSCNLAIGVSHQPPIFQSIKGRTSTDLRDGIPQSGAERSAGLGRPRFTQPVSASPFSRRAAPRGAGG